MRLGFLLGWLGVGAWGCGGATPAPSAPSAPAAEAAPAAPAESAPSSGTAASCANPQLDDLEDGDNRSSVVDGRGGYWYTFKDSAGTTITPDGNFQPAEPGAKSAKAAHISGKQGASGTVYAGVGFNLVEAPGTPYDLSQVKGVCFDVKGKGPARFKLPDVNTAPEGKVCKDCYNDFGADFELPAEWKEQCFKLADLKQQQGWGEQKPALTPSQVFAVQWQVSRNGIDYDLWVDNIRLSCD